jgi:hypothetical protein
MEERGSACTSLVERPGGKRPFRRPNCRWEDNIKMNLRELGLDNVSWFIWQRISTD